MARFIDALKQLSAEIPQGPPGIDPFAQDDFVRLGSSAAKEQAATEPPRANDTEPPVIEPTCAPVSEPPRADDIARPQANDVTESPSFDTHAADNPVTYDFADVDPAYVAIRETIVRQANAGKLRTLAFVGAGDVPDRASIVASVALALVGVAPGEVLAVDADFESPDRRSSATEEAPALPESLGLADLLQGTKTVSDVVTRTQTDGLVVIPGGHLHIVRTPLSEATLASVLDDCRRRFPFVVIDAGEWDAPAAQTLAKHCDAAHFIVHLGSTHRDVARRAIDQYQESGVRLVGSVVAGA